MIEYIRVHLHSGHEFIHNIIDYPLKIGRVYIRVTRRMCT